MQIIKVQIQQKNFNQIFSYIKLIMFYKLQTIQQSTPTDEVNQSEAGQFVRCELIQIFLSIFIFLSIILWVWRVFQEYVTCLILFDLQYLSYFCINLHSIQNMFKFDKKNHKIQLLSENWEQPIGQYCRTCRMRLKSEECISACGCLLFCHQQCFVQQISPYLTVNSQVKCLRCDKVIQFTMKQTAFWVCNRRPAYILAVIGGIMILVGSFLMIFQGFYHGLVTDKVAYGLLSAAAIIFLASIIKTSRRKVVKISDVKVIDTKMLGKNETQKGLLQKTKFQQSSRGGSMVKLQSKTESKVDFEGQYQMM